MIYSLNEGFFDKKPNKFAISNPKETEDAIKAVLKYYEDSIKYINKMAALVGKEDYFDTDGDKMADYMTELSKIEEKLKDIPAKARRAQYQLLKAYATKEYNEADIPEGASKEYRALHKKVCKNGEFVKAFMQHSRTLYKHADRYDSYRKRDMNTIHKNACEQYGGMVGILIGSIPFFNPFKKLPEGARD